MTCPATAALCTANTASASTTKHTTATTKKTTMIRNLYERIIIWRHTRRKHKHMKYKNLEPSDD